MSAKAATIAKSAKTAKKLLLAAVCCVAAWMPLHAQQRDVRLLDAVKRRDDKAFVALMRAKADVNASQPDGATALAWAVHLGERRMAEALLDAGATADTVDEYGETPVTLAAANGDARLGGVDIGTVPHQLARRFETARSCGDHDRSLAVPSRGAGVAASRQQPLDQRSVAVGRRQRHRRLAVLISGVRVRSRVEQRLGHVPLTEMDRPRQRRRAIRLRRIDVHLVAQQ